MLTQDDDAARSRPLNPSSPSAARSPGKRQAPTPASMNTQGPASTQPRQSAVPRGGSVSGDHAARPVPTPPRRRSGAPTSIPNFPNPHDHRNPSPAATLPSSPIRSPGPSSPPQSPPTSKATPHMSFKLPMTQPSFLATPGTAQSPWQLLGATSGAPTPSIDGPGRGSPHLGGPFEQLNLNGSWSGGNLFAEPSGSGTDMPSLALPSRSGSLSGGSGMNAEMLAKYRNMAGRASASGSAGTASGSSGSGTPMEGIESSGNVLPKLALPASLARRRGSLPKNALGVPSPPAQHSTKAPSPLGTGVADLPKPGLRPLAAGEVPKFLAQPRTLVLDVRPPSAYLISHIPSSHSVPVPSTLLRRPAFTVAKVLLMLSPDSREAVSDWKEKSDIVLVDVDSTTAGAGSLMEGLAAKFEREGFKGVIWFIKGGQAALEAKKQVQMVGSEEVAESDGMTSPGPGAGMASPSGNFSAGGLGSFAFLHGSTGSGNPIPRNQSGGLPFTPSANNRANPFDSMSVKTQPLSLKSMALGAVAPAAFSFNGSASSTGSGSRPKLQPANPFFDNIRQNLELSHGGITERIPLSLSAEEQQRASELPDWLGKLVGASPAEGAERMAQQFYRVERNEQKRLQALMDWHSQGSGGVLSQTTQDDLTEKGQASTWAKQTKRDQADVERLEGWRVGQGSTGADGEEYYPFSITAGVERGSKNRYKNIWPYDFSRVRLVTPCEDESDYINASYIQPRGTSRRYIATQGPLDATFRDFWTLIWEQDVRVIVMLTKQFEGGLVKCGNYWQDQNYGSIHVHLDRQTGGDDFGRPANAGFDFSVPTPSANKSAPLSDDYLNIRREFVLTHDKHPGDSRKIVQLQCTHWPDFDVPTSPEVLLTLIRDVADARKEVEPGPPAQQDAPVLIHCSAGIGRTGSFILVDSILDGLNRQRQTEEEKRQAVEAARHPVLSEDYALTKPIKARSRANMSSPRELSSVQSDSSFSRGLGHSGRVKSVSFASGDKTLSDHEKRRQSASSGLLAGLSPIPPHEKALSAPVKPHAQSQTQGQAPGFDWLPPGSAIAKAKQAGEVDNDAMEVDSPAEYPTTAAVSENNSTIDQWLSYREDKGTSDAGTTTAGRRPSMGSAFAEKDSPEYLSTVGEDEADPEHPQPISGPNERPRSPTPLDDMQTPVLEVLESMRVQRMSLVQSLRQFVFAYKVIIHQTFAMLDEDNARAAAARKGSKDTLTSMSTTTDDDDTSSKRRASPTELVHDRPSMEVEGEERQSSVKGALGRKASVKRMKQDVVGE